jgi:hypothetical protein
MYDAVVQYQGQDPKGWGRYFYTPDDNGTSPSSGLTYYSGDAENAFFNSHQLRLLPIAGQGVTADNATDYTAGYDDAQSNLQAILKAFGQDMTLFYESAGAYYCAFMLDCEPAPDVFTDYLHGWLEGMEAGVTNSSGDTLYGWTGIYGSQDACTVWESMVDCANNYSIRPKFLDVAHYVDSTAIPSTWDEADTSPNEGTCEIAVGQVTDIWQYYGDASVNDGEYYVDLDLANPNIDFHTAVGQYCPIPPSS